MITMRLFSLGVGFFVGTTLFAQPNSLPPWTPGMLDIHHISTGRGNAAFLVFPDSTALLVDAGEISDAHPRTLSARNGRIRPDSSRNASAWIADYIRQFHPDSDHPEIDYAVITHFHDDHFGEWDPEKPTSPTGKYALTGIMGVGDQIRIRQLIDRGFHFPVNLKSPEFMQRYAHDEYHIVQTLHAYWTFIEWHQQNNQLTYDTLRPGASDQISLKHPEQFADFTVRNIAAGGRIWNGSEEGAYFKLFEPGQYPGENPLSICLKISYGPFDYFTGGDISGIDELGQANLNSVEAHVAPVIGPVDVATLNHHGNRDSQSPYYVRTLRPRVWVQQCWSSDHPGEEVLRRITAQSLYPGERSVFTTDMLEANVLVIGEKINRSYANLHGHVVIRVMPGGKQYWVYVLNDFSTEREIIARFGPFESR